MSLRTRLAATLAVLALLVSAVAAVVHSSFTATAGNDGNTFEAGSISLTDDDSAKVLFDVHGLEPNSPPVRRCVTLKYGSTGGLASSVRLFGETNGALAEHLKLELTRGSFLGPKPDGNSCTGFAASTTVFLGPLSRYPQTWGTGIVDPNPTWRSGDTAIYEIAVSLTDSDGAQGKSATQSFTFEARTS